MDKDFRTVINMGRDCLRGLGCGIKKAGRKVCSVKNAIIDEIRDDIEAVKQRDPAAKNNVEILLLYSGVHAILAYRVAQKL